jgi:hypothetical protein
MIGGLLLLFQAGAESPMVIGGGMLSSFSVTTCETETLPGGGSFCAYG